MTQGRSRATRVRPALTCQLPGRKVPVYVANGLLARADALLGRGQGKCEIVTDTHVDSVCGARVASQMKKAGWQVHKTVLRPGETIKTTATIRALHEDWFSRGYDRHTPIIACGGGTVGDAVGFAAATFLRGVPFWQFPTSIIAQVDAAIGGKVGINHRRGKNLIGSFYHPQGIVIDPAVLDTLPARERRSGLAEVVKYGVISDPKIFAACEKRVADWSAGQRPLDEPILRACVRIKLDIVAADETDRGLRHHLNFGHTLGHAFERWGGFKRLRHGEAIAIGMAAAGWLAAERGLWKQSEFERLETVCRQLRPVRKLPPFSATEIASHLKLDKKRVMGRIRWVLPRGIGRVALFDDVSPTEIRATLRYVRGWLGRYID